MQTQIVPLPSQPGSARLRRPAALVVVAAAGLIALGSTALGQIVPFDAGSSGALGDVVVETNTQVLLPPDGKLHYKSLTIAAGATLSFIKNAQNTPVYLLSQGDVTINGRISVSGNASAGTFGRGLGGPGGYDGGNRGVATVPPGDGQGPGGGRGGLESGPSSSSSAGSGVFLRDWGTGSTNSGSVYGTPLLIPLIGGSGGGGTPNSGGGGGGGAILIASNTRVTVRADGNAEIDASGGEWGTSGAWNGGSGGAVRLVAPRVVAGKITVANRNLTGSPGRVRLDALDFSGSNWGFVTPAESLSFGSMLVTGLEAGQPRMEIVSVAGKPLPVDSILKGYILLPSGSAGQQAVVVRAHNFGTRIPVSVVTSPENGPTVVVEGVIDNTTQNPASATFNVDVPANTPVKIHAWTR